MPHVYALDDLHGLTPPELNALIGGKAAGLATMINQLGLPVPPGFTITTAACNTYLKSGWPDGLDGDIHAHLRRLEEATGRGLGDAGSPLLVSVRSGAPVSMPGMMDTILNLGLNDATAEGLAEATGDPRFAADCRRRFRAQFMDVVGADRVPDDPGLQLKMAVEAVFKSWNSERARAYRARERIADDLGTAVTVQAMVFGNLDESSASGVLFTRNPATGEPNLYGDVMYASQGEDVVAGTHETQPLGVLNSRMPEIARELQQYARALEIHFGDLCDIEFTIERGKLWLLQVRVGKRTPQAALRIAVDMAQDEGFPLTRGDAVKRAIPYLVHPPMVSTGPPGTLQPLATGLPASPGIATGEIVTSSTAAQETAATGRSAILVRSETSPADVPGMAAAAGVLTASGGVASHAAVVARGWGIPAVVGTPSLLVGDATIAIGEHALKVGDTISIDGGTGAVYAGVVPRTSTVAPEAATLLQWAKELGIEIPRDDVGTESRLQDDNEVTADDVVRALDIKASATPDGLTSALLSNDTHLRAALHGLISDGLVERAGGMVRLTAKGRMRAKELMRADQQRWGHDQAQAALDGFAALDGRMKNVVTAWQVKDVGGAQTPNDHSDAAYDEAVLARLAALHEDTLGWLSSLSPAPDRFRAYSERLGRAQRLVRGGDERFVASPRVDSYHSVWFELHEDLIRLAGRTRAEETAAGRA